MSFLSHVSFSNGYIQNMSHLTDLFKMSLLIVLFTGLAGSLGACNSSPSNGGYDIPIEKERRGSH